MNPPALPPLQVTCGVLRRDGRVLVARRADNRRWELPGGKQQPGEDLAACLARELREELGVEVQVLERLALVSQRAPEKSLDLHCFSCRLVSGAPQALEHLELAWVTPDEMLDLDLCRADRQLAQRLAESG